MGQLSNNSSGTGDVAIFIKKKIKHTFINNIALPSQDGVGIRVHYKGSRAINIIATEYRRPNTIIKKKNGTIFLTK